MKNSTILKILGIIAIIVLLIYSAITALKPNPGTTNQPGNTDSTLDIPTPSGQVQVKDVTKNPVEKSDDAVAVAETPNYHIVYYAKDQAFLITLLSQPLQLSRNQAEDALLKDLNIGIADACKLKVSLTVPYNVDQNLSGKDYGLSFCSNGIRF